MLVNKGFSFSNAVGKYKITSSSYAFWGIEYDKSVQFDDLEPVSPDLQYRDLYITEVYFGNRLTDIYSSSAFGDEGVVTKFAAIDIENTDKILSFCNTYGLPYSSRLYKSEDNIDYIFFGTTRNDFRTASSSFNSEIDSIPLHEFCAEVITMRSVLRLIEALDKTNDYKTILDLVVFFALHPSIRYYDCWPLDYGADAPYDYFRVLFTYNNRFDDQSFADKVTSFINKVHRLYEVTGTELDDYHEDFNFLLDGIGYRFTSIISQVISFTSIINVSETGDVEYGDHISSETIAENMNTKELRRFASALVTSIINWNTSHIVPLLEYNGSHLTGDWSVPDLLSAMYLELFMTINPEQRFAKCENRTCGQFFIVSKSNQKKKFCSHECAVLEAKRAERMRKKQKEK